jgi:hypothetical protein
VSAICLDTNDVWFISIEFMLAITDLVESGVKEGCLSCF